MEIFHLHDITKVLVQGERLGVCFSECQTAVVRDFEPDGLSFQRSPINLVVLSIIANEAGEDRGLVVNEITTIRDNSKRIIDSYETNKDLFDKCEELLISMNPDKQREFKSAKELTELKDELSEMKRMLSAILGTKSKEE